VIKHLSINYAQNIGVDKKIVHKLVSFIKKELNFTISSLIINFVSAELITKININYLDHKYSTDIITFNYSGNHRLLDGELYISVEDADLNAKKYRISSKFEYFRLVIHGILHLLNYDDIKKHDRVIMKKLENRLLSGFKNYLKG